MPLATLSIDLEARIARFESDLGKASRQIDKLANTTRSSFAGIGDVFAGATLSGAVQELVGSVTRLLPQLLDSVASLQDLSEETGASATGLADMRTAADVVGVSVADLAGFMVKLTGNLSDLKGESKGAGNAIRALGLNVDEFRKLTPDQQIRALGEAFAKFEDGSGKTAVALQLFGRGGAQVLKFFKEYDATAERYITLTDEQIKRADAFADAQARSSSEVRQAAEFLATQALPALSTLGKAARDVVLQFVDVRKAGADVKAEAVFLDWAEAAAIAVATVGEAVVGVVKFVGALGGSVRAVAADIQFLGQVSAALNPITGGLLNPNNRKAIEEALTERNRVVQEANQRYVDLWNYDGTRVTRAIRKSFEDQRAALAVPESLKDTRQVPQGASLAFDLPDPAVIAKAQREFERLMEQIRERQVLASQELETGERISAARQFEAKITADLAASTSTLSAAKKAEVATALASAVATIKQAEARAEALKLSQAETRAAAQALQAQQATTEQQRQQLREIGLTTEQLETLRITRLEETLAIEEERIAILELMGMQAQELNQRRLVAAEIREQIALRQRAVAITSEQDRSVTRGVDRAFDSFLVNAEKKADLVTGSVSRIIGTFEDDLTTSLRNGEFSFRRLADVAIEELLRINIVKPALAWLFSASGGGSALTSLASFVFSAKGNAFNGGAVVPFAGGGIFGSLGGIMKAPTLFRMRGGVGVGGEAGDEAVLPLARTATGQLGVRAAGGGGGSVQQLSKVDNHFIIGSPISRSEVLQIVQAFGQQLKGEILNSMRNDGVFAGGG